MDANEYVSCAVDAMNSLPEAFKNKREHFLAALNQICAQLDKPCLNVALIGNFSSGKSTFINALIKKELLKTAWSATTAAPTYIYYHDKEETLVVVETSEDGAFYMNHSEQRERFEKIIDRGLPSDLKEMIAVLSTSNEFSDVIQKIKIYVSGDERIKHICLIDTPGVNPGAAEAAAHVMKTKDVLLEDADITIVLFQETQVFTNSFKVFLEENARHFMKDAIFVITMMDLAEEEEREELIAYVKQHLQNAFNIENPEVCECCAKAVFAETPDRKSEYWAELFDELRDKVVKQLADKQEVIFRERTVSQLKDLLHEMDGEATRSISEKDREKDLLKENPVEHMKKELDDYYNSFLTYRYGEFIEKVKKNVRKEYEKTFPDISSKAASQISICTKVHGTESGTVTGYIHNYLPDEISGVLHKMANNIQIHFSGFRELQKEFYIKNKKMFQNHNLKINSDVPHFSPLPEQPLLDILFSNMAGALTAAGEELERSLGRFGNLKKSRERAMSCVHNYLEKAHKDSISALDTWMEENIKKMHQGMASIREQIEAEYARGYEEASRRLCDRKKELESDLNRLGDIHQSLQRCLDALKDS